MKVFAFHPERPEQPLLTKKSFSLALSPPRAPPLGTAHRSLLASADDENLSEKPFVLSASEQQDVRTTQALARLQQHLFDQHTFLRKDDRRRRRLPHPHLTLVPTPGDRLTRYLSTILPLRLQNYTRDSGLFRCIVDHLVQASAPLMALTAPSSALRDFLYLTSVMRKHAYGDHPMQFIELYMSSERPVRNLVFFVHGGAWGSGMPWFYRLMAAPFVCCDRPDTAVAVIGYRTYPSSPTVDEQVEDCQLAANYLLQEYPDLCQGIITVMGHSSGAHVALLMLVEQAKEWMRKRKSAAREEAAVASFNVTNFVGLSGPYDISHHFDYEASRGVEELSPMKPVCGYSREAFRRNSPHLRLQHFLVNGGNEESLIGQCMPPNMALVHGMEDDTVPFTATGEAARVLRSCGITSCDELYVARTGHQDVVVQMMVGGPTQEVVMSWIREKEEASNEGMSTKFDPTLFAPSKL
ncbi:hypothetical protein FisN_20Lh187 [Fistulifera solaris]|uniref:BD-FAE-like domain-containing protein n=1 Tax=Fistulifera solaris TaxID=1519565 RepID=A0A1Z5KRD0_FISSO|nr:hypothetical protein FisN_20Lh187 [Fistulifera solaris]|eukprot:GAX28884.1 hypothetical protein FisN_20Lh187 [Fistulifera solaris]